MALPAPMLTAWNLGDAILSSGVNLQGSTQTFQILLILFSTFIFLNNHHLHILHVKQCLIFLNFHFSND